MASHATLAEDPQGFVDELDKQGKMVQGDDGNQYYVPAPDEEREINSFVLSEIRQAETDHAGFRERVARNERAYEAIPEKLGEKPMIVLPIIRRDCDQIAAWYINQILRPHPVFSFDPCFPATYQVPVETGNQMMPQVMLDTTAEMVANSLEHAVEYVVRERMKFRALCETVIGEVVRGRGPAIVKVVFDPKFHAQVVNEFQAGAFQQAIPQGPRIIKKEDGEPVKAYAIPTENFLMPADEESPLKSRWVAEQIPMNTSALKRELRKPESLIKPAEWDQICSQTGDTVPANTKSMKGQVDGRVSSVPVNRHDTREVWFEYYIDGEDEPQKLMGLFHAVAGRFIWITPNPYHHKRNPYVAFFWKKRPFRFSGSSTAEELMSIQTLASQILHLALQNAIVANSVVFAANPDTDAFDWMKENEVEGGDVIPGSPNDVQALNLGREHRTMMPEVSFLLDLGRTVGGVSQYDDGSYIPGRTSPNTVDMIMKSGQMVPLAQLLSFADGFCEVIWLWLKTYKQYKPFGEMMYVMDQEEKELVEIPFRLPDEQALDNFRISLTAADELAAQETTPEHLAMIANLLDQDAEQLAKILGPLVSMDTPDSIMPLLEKMISRKQEVIEAVINLSRSDSRDFTISKEMLRTVAEEKRLVKQQLEAQQAAAAAAGGGAPGAPGAPAPPGGQPNAGPAVPAPGGAGPVPPA